MISAPSCVLDSTWFASSHWWSTHPRCHLWQDRVVLRSVFTSLINFFLSVCYIYILLASMKPYGHRAPSVRATGTPRGLTKRKEYPNPLSTHNLLHLSIYSGTDDKNNNQNLNYATALEMVTHIRQHHKNRSRWMNLLSLGCIIESSSDMFQR